MFPLIESAGRRYASLHWVLRASSPASTVLSSATTSYRPSRRTSFPSLGGTSVALVGSLLDGRVHSRGLELVTRFSVRDLPRRRQDLPSSWGTPIVRLHMFQADAGRIAYTRPLRCCSVALGDSKAKAPTRGLSTLNSMAFKLVVYASQDRLPCRHARLTSSCWSSSTGRAFHPQGSDERFQSCKLHLILLSQASLGARNLPDARNGPASGQILLFCPFLASAVHTSVG